MKIATSVWTGVALLAMAQTAQAARVSGRYVLMSFSQCQAQFTTTPTSFVKTVGSANATSPHSHPTTTGPGVLMVNPAKSGEFNIGVGTITFPTTAGGASSGNATLQINIVSGAALKIDGSGNTVGTHVENISGTFSITNTTFTFTPTAPVAEPPMTWTMRPGNMTTANLTTGVARTLYMTRKESNECLNALTATKQAP